MSYRFQFVMEGRVFKFEADSADMKKKWVNAVMICREYALRFEEQSNNTYSKLTLYLKTFFR